MIYTKNQKITFTIDKFIPKVMEIDTYLSNVYFSQIHYAKTKIVLHIQQTCPQMQGQKT